MATIELSLSTNYVRDWHAGEALRELVQNTVDSHTLGYRMEMYQSPGAKSTIHFRNHGVTLRRSHLLIGETTKADRDDQVGQFGEGLKLALLVLARENVPVTIRTGSERWVPRIQYSKTFKRDVLAIQITGGQPYINEVDIQVHGFGPKVFEAMRDICRHIRVPDYKIGNSVLTDPAEKGKIYCKGVLIKTESDAIYGYDLRNLRLNRDRGLVDAASLREEVGKALHDFKPNLDEFLPKLAKVSSINLELAGLTEASYLQDDLLGLDEWLGERVLVATTADEHKASCTPLETVKVPEVIASIFWKQHDKSRQKVQALLQDKDELALLRDFSESQAELVDELNRLKAILGYEHIELKIAYLEGYVAGKCFESAAKPFVAIQASNFGWSREDAFATLIHELAHLTEGAEDGSVKHLRTIERLAGKAVAKLLT